MRPLLAALLVLALPATAQEATAPTRTASSRPTLSKREQRILRLMEVTGAAKAGLQMADMMLAQFKANPSVPEAFINRFRERIDTDAFAQLLLPVYAAHLSEEDVEAAIRFYESPAGQRFIQAQPKIMQDAAPLAQQWAIQLAERVQAELEAEAAPTQKPAQKPARSK
jgi:uncharacterized protein